MRALSFALKKKGLEGSSIMSSPMRLISFVINFSFLSFISFVSSRKILGSILSGSAADPFGKDNMALHRSNAVLKRTI